MSFEKFEPYLKGLALISTFMGLLTLPLSFIATVKLKQEKVRQNEQLCDTIIINNDYANNIKFRQ